MGCGRSAPKGVIKGLNVNSEKKGNALEAKVVLLGDSGVGKSSIAMRYVNHTFSEAFEVTIGGGYLQQVIRLKDNISLKMDIWDTGGQERFRALLQLYYREADAALICYDVTSDKSMESCEYWVNELKSREEHCLLCLVGNKTDMPQGERRVEHKKAEVFAAAHGMLWMETSAKTGENVDKLFERLANDIVRKKLPAP